MRDPGDWLPRGPVGPLEKSWINARIQGKPQA